MGVRFIYESDDYNPARELICTHVCEYVSRLLTLPVDIQIVFAIMDNNVYGHTFLSNRFKNRISINNIISPEEIPNVLVHELIHLSQIETGILAISNNRKYSWRGKVVNITESDNYNNYVQLPWEKDVAKKQQTILPQVIEYLSTL